MDYLNLFKRLPHLDGDRKVIKDGSFRYESLDV